MKKEENEATILARCFSNFDSVLNNRKKTVSSLGTVKSASAWLRKNKARYEKV